MPDPRSADRTSHSASPDGGSVAPARAARPVRPPGTLPPGAGPRPPGGDGAASVRPARRINPRKTLFRLHGWLGLNFGLLLFVICFSGSWATLSHEIDWLLDPSLRVPAREAPYDWTAMHAALEAAYPEGQNLGVYAPLAPGFAALSYVAIPNGQNLKVYLDPYTGEITGATSFFNVQRFFRSFHRRFFDGVRGIVIVTLTGFVLLAASLTGFLFYKGWLKALFTLRRGRGARLLWSDLHKLTGIWGLAFTVLIAATGVFYFVEVVFQGADNYEALLPPPLPGVEEASLAGLGPQPELLPASAYVRAAETAYPELDVRSVRMPHRANETVYVDGQAGNPFTRDRADKVLLHPFTGEVLGVQRTADLGLVPFVTDAVDPLHFGYFGGLATKALWCLLGLMLSFSILAGAYLWVVRSRPAAGARAGGTRPARKGLPWLRGAAVAFAVTTAYFVVVVFSTVEGVRAYGPQHPPAIPVEDTTVGPYRVRVECAAPCRPAEGARYTVRFLADGLPTYRAAHLRSPGAEAAELSGIARAASAALAAPHGAPIELAVILRDGSVHRATFQAPAAGGESWATMPFPEPAPGTWWAAGIFIVLTVGVLAGWLALLVRAARPR